MASMQASTRTHTGLEADRARSGGSGVAARASRRRDGRHRCIRHCQGCICAGRSGGGGRICGAASPALVRSGMIPTIGESPARSRRKIVIAAPKFFAHELSRLQRCTGGMSCSYSHLGLGAKPWGRPVGGGDVRAAERRPPVSAQRPFCRQLASCPVRIDFRRGRCSGYQRR